MVEWWDRDIDKTAYATAVISRVDTCMKNEDYSSLLSRRDSSIPTWDYHSMLQFLFATEFLRIDKQFATAVMTTNFNPELQHQTATNLASVSETVTEKKVELPKSPLQPKKPTYIDASKYRNRAAMAAARQRLAFYTLCSLNSTTSILHPLSSANPSPLDSDMAQLDLNGKGSRKRCADALINLCPWLGPEANSHLPRFLWSIEERRTIDYKDELSRPPYTIISHTWGRWKVVSQNPSDPNPAVYIKGVEW